MVIFCPCVGELIVRLNGFGFWAEARAKKANNGARSFKFILLQV